MKPIKSINRIYGLSLVALMMGVLAVGCGSQDAKTESNALFPSADVMTETDVPVKLTDLFPGHRLVNLETNDSSLIEGNFIKILKRDGCYYVRSFDEIIKFDSEGRFIGKLSKKGQGADEYGELIDFEVASMDGGKKEILVSTDKNKKIKRYDALTFDYSGEIVNDDYINKLYYVNDSTILTVTPGDVTFKIIGTDGKVRKSFMDKDVANYSLASVAFRRMADGRVIYQIDATNEAVVYDPAKDEFSYSEIVPQTANLLTVENNRDYYEKFGYRGMTKKTLEDFVWVSAFQVNGDDYILTNFHPGGRRTITVGNTGKSVTYTYSDGGSNLQNDLPTNDMRLLSTAICCDSDEGFLFMLEGEDFTSDDMVDQNPVLLDVTHRRK